jgi:hypothetical protein
MRGTGVSHYAAVLPEIMWANRDGFRLVLPSCFRVPLAEERDIAIVAQADRPAEQSNREPLVARGLKAPADTTVYRGVHRSP